MLVLTKYKPTNPTEWLLLIAALSFIPTLFFYLVGEEGSYVVSVIEMQYSGNWLQQLIYGGDFGRPPLLNWLIIPVAKALGWQHTVIAMRIVSVSATLGTVAWLYWLSLRLFSSKSFAAFAALAGLSLADWLLYRGWLSYSDPVFSFFTFGAMATLWIAIVNKNSKLLFFSILLVSCGMFTKAFTAYVFYGTVVFVLLWGDKTRIFLLKPQSIFTLSLSLLIPVVWFASIPHTGNSGAMWSEVTRKFTSLQFNDFLTHFIEFPLEVIIRLSPAVLLAIFFSMRNRLIESEDSSKSFGIGLWITGLGFLPYWLSPQSSVRYLLPLYPLIALLAARIIWRSGEAGRKLAINWFAGIVVLKLILVLFIFPAYQAHYRGENYAQTAQIIIERTKNFPLYATDSRAIGLSIVGYVDILRYPQAPILMPPDQFSSGYVLAMAPSKEIGEVAETFSLAAEQIFLLCRGLACKSQLFNPQ